MEERKWYKSRKFWLTVIEMTAAVLTLAYGIFAGNDDAVKFALGMLGVGAGTYKLAEAYTDGQSLKADATVTTKTVSATASDKATVQAVMGTEPKEAPNA